MGAGFYDTPGTANRVVVAAGAEDTYAYVADAGGGLVIVRFASYQVYLPLARRGQP